MFIRSTLKETACYWTIAIGKQTISYLLLKMEHLH